jgi:hypothetical protein
MGSSSVQGASIEDVDATASVHEHHGQAQGAHD